MRRLLQRAYERFAPEKEGSKPEHLRQARLVVAFSLLGAFFGSVFGGFYVLIGHYWGAAIIGVCCALFGFVPNLLLRGASAARAGNHYCLILLAGFFCLCWVEGGMHGHALAWLVIVPLCALLLTSRRGAIFWTMWSVVATLATTVGEAWGISPPVRYPAGWHVAISTLGYASLVAFLFGLGLVFENGRRRAHDQMERTLTELAAANQRLLRLNEEKSEFLGIAAHDLRSPLTVVMGCSEMLATDRLPPERARGVAQNILSQAERMRRLISDLLDLNAIEEGRMNLSAGAVVLADCVGALVENHRAAAAKKGIALETTLDPEAVAIADEKALQQILDNLISNALKFTKPNGRVTVEAGRGRAKAWIAVSDTGPGMSAQDKEKLFTRFARLSARPTGGESSHGLGLSIVKRLVDSMQGTIECDSEVGRGTTFRIELPLGVSAVSALTVAAS